MNKFLFSLMVLLQINSYAGVNTCPDGGVLDNTTCLKTCRKSVSEPCATNCVWWAGGVSYHTGCGQNFYDTWGAGTPTDFQGACEGYSFPVARAENYDCSYAATVR